MSSPSNNIIQTLAGIATIIGTVYFIYISLIKDDIKTSLSEPDGTNMPVNEIHSDNPKAENVQDPVITNKTEKSTINTNKNQVEKNIVSTSSIYISNKSENSSGSLDIAISIQDETQNLSDELINGVSDFYISKGYNSKYNIFKDIFFSSGRFTDFYNGQLTFINEAELQKYCDKIALGKMTCTYKSNSQDAEMTTAEAILYLKVISVTELRIEKSITINGTNTGWSKQAARANTIKEILSQLSNKL